MKAIQILHDYTVVANGQTIHFSKGTFIDRYEIRGILRQKDETYLGYNTIVSVIPEKDVKTFESLMQLSSKIEGYDYLIMKISK